MSRISDQRAELAESLRSLAYILETATDNHIASSLPHDLAYLVQAMAELHSAVEAQRAVAFRASRS